MKTIRKVIMCMCVVMMVMCFGIVLSYSQDKPLQEKPTEKIMQNIISTIVLPNTPPSNITFPKFQITNGYFSKTKGGGGESGIYCIEVNYIMRWTHTYDKDHFVGTTKVYYQGEKRTFNSDKVDDQWSFEKRGNKWYGWKGWEAK